MNDENCSCLKDILCTILKLQQSSQIIEDTTINSCNKPFLGDCPIINCLNTRLVTLYSCCNANIITLPYTLNGVNGESSIFRIEKLDGCCATFRILTSNPDTSSQQPYVATDSFFTIRIDCIGAIKCLGDTFISCI
ncbi:MAG TPA: CotY/CotZ family spore coat protein [Bacilli bacterium]|nr:CotY/CotZ family spore coat protein [Bacilli bacterium]